MQQQQHGTTLVTGASAGIGEALARTFAANRHDLVLVARRKTRLEQLARELRNEHDIEVTVLPADLAAAGEPQRLYDELAARDIVVEVHVNNAGVMLGGAFRRMDPDALDGMIRLNVAVPTLLCRVFLDDMVSRGLGRILNVASLGAFQPVPSLASYAATKAYLLSFTEALSEELRGKGVTATVVCPGFTDTDMARGSGGESLVPEMLLMPPERVAEVAYRACMRGDVVAVPGLANTLTSTATQLLPRWLVRNAAGLAARRGR